MSKYAAQVKVNVEAKAEETKTLVRQKTEEIKADLDVKTEAAKLLIRQQSDSLKQKLPEAVQQKLA